jgi:type IV pilus assembly protein PilC
MKKIRAQHITQWTQQLALLLEAHLPLAQALQLLAQTQTHGLLRSVTLSIYNEVMSGMPLSHALAAYPLYFDATYRYLIIAAEQSGKLAPILQGLALQQKTQQQLRAQLQKAFTYPSLVLMVGGLVFILLLVWVVPQIASVFSQFDQQLPWFTACILGLAHFSQYNGIYFLSGFALFGFSIYMMKKYIPGWNERLDSWRWHCPGIGTLLQSAGCVLFANTLATLLAAGIPLISGIPTSLQVLNNRHVQLRLLAAVSLIKQGHSFSYALQQTQLFPQLALQMWHIGEQTGKLSELLQDSANYYQQQLDSLTEQLIQLLEPMLLIVLGILIGSVVIAMYLPLFNLGLVLG